MNISLPPIPLSDQTGIVTMTFSLTPPDPEGPIATISFPLYATIPQNQMVAPTQIPQGKSVYMNVEIHSAEYTVAASSNNATSVSVSPSTIGGTGFFTITAMSPSMPAQVTFNLVQGGAIVGSYTMPFSVTSAENA